MILNDINASHDEQLAERLQVWLDDTYQTPDSVTIATYWCSINVLRELWDRQGHAGLGANPEEPF